VGRVTARRAVSSKRQGRIDIDGATWPAFSALLRQPRPLRRQFWLSPGATVDDAGFFGPDSMAWRLHADVSFAVGGYRALLVEALHPLAIVAVEQHSRLLDDPWQRLWRTSRYVFDVTFGDRATALAAAGRVRAIHRAVRGTDPVTGLDYRADDPALLLWVHAVLVDSVLVAFDRYGAGLPPARADQYVAEMVTAAELVGIPADVTPRDAAGLRDYLAGVPLRLTPGAERVRGLVLDPPVSWWWRPLAAGFRAAVLAILPETASEVYGFGVSQRRRAVTRAAGRGLCRAGNALARLPFREDMFAPVPEHPTA
jgi:uncharacterized protein (DUF2236 family)